MKSTTKRRLVRNVSHLGLGQVASTTLGFFLNAVIGRALEPAQLGILYIVLAISSFAYVVVDWGQSSYLVREMARGRADEPILIGSAFLVRLVTFCVSTMVVAGIALALGYNGEVVELALLAMIVAVPAAISVPLNCSFRGKDRMDVDALINTIGKAVTLAATVIGIRFGGGLTEVILAQGIGGTTMLLVAAIAALRFRIRVELPTKDLVQEVFWRGMPIGAFTLVIASQPFLEVLILSAFTSSVVVGWYGAYRTVFGIVSSPAIILVSAIFPELSRAALSLPDLRRTIDAAGRVLFIAAGFTSAALYLLADNMVAIVYGHGRFEQTASILRVSAVFVPLLFFGYLLASAMVATNRNKAMAVVSVIKIAFCTIVSWLVIGHWQQLSGNGAIALVTVAGIAEIPTSIACWVLLPRDSVGSTTAVNFVRSCAASVLTIVPLSLLGPLAFVYLVPLCCLLFAVAAMLVRLLVLSDLKLVVRLARSKLVAPGAPKASDE